AAHAGATPRELRRDAVVAVADLIMRLDARWSEWLARGKQLVVTHGIATTNAQEHAISRIAGGVTISLEIRAEAATTLQLFHGVVREEARAVAQHLDVTFEFDTAIGNSPAAMDPRWISRLDTLCGEEGVASMRMPSGAGHDAAVFSHAGVPTAMLFIRNRFGSHNPAQHMDLADLITALPVKIPAIRARPATSCIA